MPPLSWYKKYKNAIRVPPNPPPAIYPFSLKFSDTPYNERSHYLDRILCTDVLQLQVNQLLDGRPDLQVLCDMFWHTIDIDHRLLYGHQPGQPLLTEHLVGSHLNFEFRQRLVRQMLDFGIERILAPINVSHIAPDFPPASHPQVYSQSRRDFQKAIALINQGREPIRCPHCNEEGHHHFICPNVPTANTAVQVPTVPNSPASSPRPIRPPSPYPHEVDLSEPESDLPPLVEICKNCGETVHDGKATCPHTAINSTNESPLLPPAFGPESPEYRPLTVEEMDQRVLERQLTAVNEPSNFDD